MSGQESLRALPSIEVRHLSKSFDGVRAVRGISFSVGDGELFGFLGPNGAGKTTTINMLTGLARPDGGIVRLGGIDCSRNPKGAQHLVGVVPDESNLYPELTGFENLVFCGALYGMPRKQRQERARALLDRFGLSEAAHRAFAGYSKGMRRKLTIAAGIIHDPSILFLDEPTSGIDVASARQIRQMIDELNTSGTTIFLTTHYIEEAERLCDRIAFIVSGELVKVDTLEALMEGYQRDQMMRFAVSDNGRRLCEALERAYPDLSCHAESETAIYIRSSKSIRVGPVVRILEEEGAEIFEARKILPSLEEVFVEITGIEATALQRENGGEN